MKVLMISRRSRRSKALVIAFERMLEEEHGVRLPAKAADPVNAAS